MNKPDDSDGGYCKNISGEYCIFYYYITAFCYSYISFLLFVGAENL